MATKAKVKKKVMKRRTDKEKLDELKRKKKNRLLVRQTNQPEPALNTKAKKASNNFKNSTKYEVYEEQPIPWTRPAAKEIIFPFVGMDIGQNFEFFKEAHKGQNVYSAAVAFCQEPDQFHKKFVVRKISQEMRKGIMWVKWGCWREEDLDANEFAKKKAAFKLKREKVLKARAEAAKIAKAKKKAK